MLSLKSYSFYSYRKTFSLNKMEKGVDASYLFFHFIQWENANSLLFFYSIDQIHRFSIRAGRCLSPLLAFVWLTFLCLYTFPQTLYLFIPLKKYFSRSFPSLFPPSFSSNPLSIDLMKGIFSPALFSVLCSLALSFQIAAPSCFLVLLSFLQRFSHYLVFNLFRCLFVQPLSMVSKNMKKVFVIQFRSLCFVFG